MKEERFLEQEDTSESYIKQYGIRVCINQYTKSDISVVLETYQVSESYSRKQVLQKMQLKVDKILTLYG